jgi:hypothetical protein
MNDPMITVLCMTWGDHINLTEETVESFLRQSYPHKRMVLVNTHPSPIVFDETPENVSVVNLAGDFYYLGDKFLHCLKYVNSDYWCHFDDDDIYLPWYLESLAELAREYPQADNWCNNWKLASGANEIKALEGAYTWCTRLYRTRPVSREIGDTVDWDTRLYRDIYQTPAEAQVGNCPAYIYRWDSGSWHYSGSGGDAEANAQARRRADMADNSAVWRPHWDRDYVQDARDYMKEGV